MEYQFIDNYPQILKDHIDQLSTYITNKRWFAEKEAHIEKITIIDNFQFDSDGYQTIECLIAEFQLRGSLNQSFIKRYFIPVLISSEPVREIQIDDMFWLSHSKDSPFFSFAEHSSAFQKALIHQNKKSASIKTSLGNTVYFQPMSSKIPLFDENNFEINPLSLDFPSSNVLTKISFGNLKLVSKTYKDLRGFSGQQGDIWLPNLEVPRYEALAEAGYPNIPELHGVTYYQTASGEKMPLNILMEFIVSEGQVGEVFANALHQLINDTQLLTSFANSQRYEKQLKGICLFARETAKTIARMHVSFARSSMPGFNAEIASKEDINRWTNQLRDNFDHAFSSIKNRCINDNESSFLSELKNRLERVSIDSFSLCHLEGRLMKTQVHGDLHADQGLIKKSRKHRLTDEFLKSITLGEESEIQQLAKELAQQIKWMDFEGPPAKESVSASIDLRQNLLTDIAGFVQAFWYMLHVSVYHHVGLNHQEPSHHEIQRKVSLVLSGQLHQDYNGIPQLTSDLIKVLSTWHAQVTSSFIHGYFDEMESQQMEHAALQKWDREAAIALTYYWIAVRAVHELRYETYGRNWGWEAIPGSRILSIVNQDLQD